MIQDILAEPANQLSIRRYGTVGAAALFFHFDTYLVHGTSNGYKIAYHVAWAATFSVSGLGRSPIVHHNPLPYSIDRSSGPVTRLPRPLFTVLARDYPSYRQIAHH